jgi:nucleoside-diphosphate-sugar epimerase
MVSTGRQETVVVTGAAGRLGSRIVKRLVEQGYTVRGTDRVPALNDVPGEFIQGDMSDTDMAARVLDGADSLIHVGAIPGPSRAEGMEIWDNNVQSTAHLMLLAKERGLRRIVFSSSAFAMGWAADPAAFVPKYLPLDEDHPPMPFEPYGLSKLVGEKIGEMVARSSSTSVVSLRFTNVVYPELQKEFPWPAPTRKKPLTLVMWAYADPRDVVEAHILGLQADIEGHEAFLIAQPSNRLAEPTVDLIKANFGDKVEIRGDLEGNASVINTAKAQHMLGWRPRYDWMAETENEKRQT